jgi:hypothetical protein
MFSTHALHHEESVGIKTSVLPQLQYWLNGLSAFLPLLQPALTLLNSFRKAT